MVYVAQIFDIVTMTMSAVLLFMSLWLWRFFRRGIMDKMCRMLIIAAVFLLLSSVFCFVMMLMESSEWLLTFHAALNSLGIVLLTYSVYLALLGMEQTRKTTIDALQLSNPHFVCIVVDVSPH